MPTPNKPAVVIRAEGRSHRTKAELELREKGEAALATGEPMKARKEVKANKKANSEFKRVSKLLEGIGKNDALTLWLNFSLSSSFFTIPDGVA